MRWHLIPQDTQLTALTVIALFDYILYDPAMTPTHDYRLDRLKVIGAFTVVLLHGSADVVITSPNIHCSMWWAGNLFDSMCRWSVPIFVMVSGALLLEQSTRTTIASFYRRRIGRLLTPLIFWSLFYIIYDHFDTHSDQASIIFNNIVHGTPYYHLWYLYMLLGLYFITPFIGRALTAISKGEQVILIGAILVISSIETTLNVLNDSTPPTFLSSFIPFTGYLIAGHYLYFQNKKEYSPRPYLLVAALCGVSTAFGTALLLASLGPKVWEVTYNCFNPMIIIMSLCIFKVNLGRQSHSGSVSGLIQLIAPETLGIYLVHPFWLSILGKIGLTPFVVHPAFGIPLTVITTFILSILSVKFIATIPFLKNTVR